ncbi:MAG: hypothetical protein ACREJ2_17275, partial [Planctomycetota bacterium]
VLLYFFGEWVRKTFEAQMELWFTLLAVLVIGGFLLIGRLKHAVPAAEAKTGPAGEAGVGAKSAAPVLAPVKSTEASGGGCSGAGGVGLGRCALRRTKQRQ